MRRNSGLDAREELTRVGVETQLLAAILHAWNMSGELARVKPCPPSGAGRVCSGNLPEYRRTRQWRRRLLSPLMLSIPAWKRPELAIDFGTANLRLIRRDAGIVFEEPSICCFGDLDTTPSLVAAGAAAQAMIDRTPRRLAVRQALRRGVLQDIDTAAELLRYALPKAFGRRQWFAPSAIVGVPSDATQAERSALLNAVRDAGLGAVRLVPEPFMAAIGADLPIDEPHGTMIVECGAGTTEVAVLSLGGICLTRSVRIGGASLDQAIADHLHFAHKFLIGDLTAERVKQAYGEHRRLDPEHCGTIEVKGRSLATRAPASLHLPPAELDRVVEKHVAHIVDVIREVLNETPPELSQDIHSHGIVLTGGGAVTPRLQQMIGDATGLPVMVADDSARCVANGLHRILQYQRRA